jgi:hypothetical protein
MLNKIISFLEKFRKNPLNEVNKKIIQRCLKLFKLKEDLNFMLAANQSGSINEEGKIYKMILTSYGEVDNWPIDKTSRWIGYIQRYLIEKEATTVQAERDFSRPLFHEAYKKLGYSVPESISVEEFNKNYVK